MSNADSTFFDDVAGDFAPTGLLKGVGDMVAGPVVEFRTRDHVPFGQTEPEKNKDGSIRQELVIIVQTEHRNWANVVKVPKVDSEDKNSADKPGSEDDGRRAIYVPQRSNVQYAIAKAMKAAGVKKFSEGLKIAVKVSNLKDTGKGNPLKEHVAVVKPADKVADPFIAEEKKEEKPAQPSSDPWAGVGAEEMPF